MTLCFAMNFFCKEVAFLELLILHWLSSHIFRHYCFEFFSVVSDLYLELRSVLWPAICIWTSRMFERYKLLLEPKETSLCGLSFDHRTLEDLVLYNTQLSKITTFSLAGSLCLCGSSGIISRVNQWQRNVFLWSLAWIFLVWEEREE